MWSIRYSCRILIKLEFSGHIFKKAQIKFFTKIRQVGAELFHADGQTDGHNEANSRFSQFSNTPNKTDEEKEPQLLQQLPSISVHSDIPVGCGAHLVSYLIRTGVSFPG
jgi:hypothetical protein